MRYHLLVISRVETDTQNRLILMTFYPTQAAIVKPRDYERLVASYVSIVDLELAESISEKGKSRLKMIMRNPAMDDEERRVLGSTYYGTIFGHNTGNDETQKGIANTLYQMMGELYKADATSEDAWGAACDAARATVVKAVEKYQSTR